MDKEIKKLVSDLENFDLPKNFESAYDKVECPLVAGETVYWYYKDEKEYFDEMGENIEECQGDISCGIVVPRWGISARKELEIDDVVVVVTSYPIEKDYPDVYWIALKRIIDDDNLVKVFQPKQEN